MILFPPKNVTRDVSLYAIAIKTDFKQRGSINTLNRDPLYFHILRYEIASMKKYVKIHIAKAWITLNWMS